MSKRRRVSERGRRRAARGLTLCFVAVIALTGAYTWTNYKNKAEKEPEVSKTEKKEIVVPSKVASGYAEKAEDYMDPADIQEKKSTAKETEENEESQVQQTKATATNVSFSENDFLLWPVDGNVKMSYSMDKTIYFETLDQYKYNPALIISGKENSQVISAAVGVVKSVDVLPQTGTTVTISLGNGYECIYGQLKQVSVNKGDYVAAGTVIGYLDAPTKYYSLEGCNLYFEMRKDDHPINPLDFVSEE